MTLRQTQHRPPVTHKIAVFRPMTLAHILLLLVCCSVFPLMGGCATAETARRPEDCPPPIRSDGEVVSSPTIQDAQAFIEELEEELEGLLVARDRAAWVWSTHITDDTEALMVTAEEKVMEYMGDKARQAMAFSHLDLPEETARKLNLLRLSLNLPAPKDGGQRRELAGVVAQLQGMYSRGRYCPERLDGQCLTLDEMVPIMATSRDPQELLDLWVGWREVAPPMAEGFARYVDLANSGAGSLGFEDLGSLWNSRYDMDPQEFKAVVERLYDQLRPLYEDLHCHVRARLVETYGDKVVPPSGPIPAHLLGNMWAQEWNHIYDLVAPAPDAPNIDLTSALRSNQVTAEQMARHSETLFTSVGLDSLPKSFWERSMLTRPEGREVVCHASAWHVDWNEDVRIKMCIDATTEDFATIHHELGHIYYFYYYRNLPLLFRDSAHDGFHEGMGDTAILSLTADYLAHLGLLDAPAAAQADGSDEGSELNELMRRALDRVSFLPWAILVDSWRWDVFEGKVEPDRYNAVWWELREKLQGVAAPVERPAGAFDPGAKYHIPANVPYARYFLGTVLQHQFHRSLCKLIGHEGPLHQCSLHGHKEVGERLKKTMEMGASKPWPEALKALTGDETEMDATAILDYFAPLHQWLKEQNKDRSCGW